jgi:tetratricopeptide (TPR) repeat protein
MRRALLVTIVAACVHAQADRLTLLKAEVMSADYRADLVALERLRAEAAALSGAGGVAYLAHYWAGYASWRTALNGANLGMGRERLKTCLEQALAEFRASIAANGEFADSHAAAASVIGWLTSWERSEARAFLAESQRLLSRARELAPDNPRVLWVLGGVYLFAPKGFGGDKERAIEIYRRMAALAAAEPASVSPKPDWGKPEAFMSLAYAHLQEEPPRIEAAREEARAALRLQPDWAYVRDVLMPQIEAKARR